jgi:hypothetical protein
MSFLFFRRSEYQQSKHKTELKRTDLVILFYVWSCEAMVVFIVYRSSKLFLSLQWNDAETG